MCDYLVHLEYLSVCSCVASPPSSLCDLPIGNTGYYLPLVGRGNDTHIEMFQSLSTNDTCDSILLNLACYYEYPPCDPVTGNAIPVCTESCDVFTDLIGPCLDTVNPDDPFVQRIRGLNCSDPFSYLYPFIFIDNSTCVNVSDFGKCQFK